MDSISSNLDYDRLNEEISETIASLPGFGLAPVGYLS